KVFYGPGNVTPETPLVRVLDKNGALMSGVPEITTQTLFGPNGLTISLPNGVANLTIGGPAPQVGRAGPSTPTPAGHAAGGAADKGIIWTVDSTDPSADQKANDGVTWNDVGPLNPGQSKDLKIGLTVGKNTGGGKFLDNAVATGVCGPAAGTAGADAAVGVPLEARVSLNLPEVNVVQGANLLPRELPRTGGVLAVLPALALTGGGLALRRSKRRKRQAR